MLVEPEFNHVFQSSMIYRFTKPGLSLCLIHHVTLKIQCFAFGGKLLTHTTPTSTAGLHSQIHFLGSSFRTAKKSPHV